MHVNEPNLQIFRRLRTFDPPPFVADSANSSGTKRLSATEYALDTPLQVQVTRKALGSLPTAYHTTPAIKESYAAWLYDVCTLTCFGPDLGRSLDNESQTVDAVRDCLKPFTRTLTSMTGAAWGLDWEANPRPAEGGGVITDLLLTATRQGAPLDQRNSVLIALEVKTGMCFLTHLPAIMALIEEGTFTVPTKDGPNPSDAERILIQVTNLMQTSEHEC